MSSSADVLAFPVSKIVRQPPKARKPPRQYTLSPEAKWQFYREIRDDTRLTADAVMAAGHLLDFYSQAAGFSAPSLGSIAKHCRFFEGEHRRHDLDRTCAAVNTLIRAGYFDSEPYEHEKGSGFPGYKFTPRKANR